MINEVSLGVFLELELTLKDTLESALELTPVPWFLLQISRELS